MAEAFASTHVVPLTFNILLAPEDVQRSVLLALYIRELVICGQICPSIKSLIVSDIAIRYKLALAHAGRMDGTRSVAIVDRLTALQKYYDTFCTGDHPLKRARLPPLGCLSSRAPIPFVVGDSVPLWRPAAAFAGLQEFNIIHTVERLGLEGYQSGSCVVDLSQDLLVFSRRPRTPNPQIRAEVCIYSLSQGRPHPLASQTYLRSSDLDLRHWANTQLSDDIQVLGDLLAWNILNGGQHEMRVLNWKTGIVVWDLTTDAFLWWHCRIISQSHVVVVTLKSLLIYAFDRDSESPPPAASSDTALCVLSLPAWSENVLEVDYPTTTSYIQFPPPPGPGDRPLFQHDPDLTLLTLYLEFSIAIPRRVIINDQYVVFVPVSTLIAQVSPPQAPLPPPPPSHTGPRVVPWDEWGPSGTRVVNPEYRCTVSPFGCSVALAQMRWTGPHAVLKVCVFDVHPWARPTRGQRRIQDTAAWGVVCATETLQDTPAFRDGIRTTFPCAFTVRDVPLEMGELRARVVLGEDGLVLVNPATGI